MPKRPARCYRDIKPHPYTRREYMRGVPDPKIRIFQMGTVKGDLPVEVALKVKESCNIQHVALESARIAANRYLQKNLGRSEYFLKIKVYPHHVLRENKMMAVAGADRLQEGMRHAFGKPIGTAARVMEGQSIIIVKVIPENVEHAMKALKRAGMKLPSTYIIEVVKGEELIKR